MDQCNGVDRRTGKDRRAKRGFRLKSLFMNGKREEIRRQDDQSKIFLVERYS